jgi:hypothetical protein
MASSAGAQEIPPGDPLSYAVFAGAEARLGTRVKVYGPVGSNDTVRLGRRNRVEGIVASPTIDLARRAKTGVLFCLLVVGGDQPCLPVTTPVVSPGSLGVGLVLPGRDNVELPRNAHRAPLEAGAYKNLHLGRGSELVLLGGDYLFDRVSLSRRASLRCAAPCRVAVRRTLRLGKRASIERLAGIDPTGLRFDVSGQGSRLGVRLATRASFGGILWAPATKVQLAKRVHVDGSVQGAQVRIGSRTQIGLEVE